MTITFTLPLPPRILHPNERPNVFAKAQATKAFRYECFVRAKSARAAKGHIKLQPPVEMTLTYMVDDNRKRDVDGLIASSKALIDGIVDSGLIPGDDAARLTLVNGGVVVGRERCVLVELVAL